MIGPVFLATAGVLLGAHYLTTGLYLRRIGQAAPQTGSIGQPRVSLIRPVCGLDHFDRETLGSSFHLDYPDYEVIFCAADEGDPAVPLLHQLIAEHPQVRARLLIGLNPVTGNPKLNNLWKGWQAATSDWICMTDSNLLLPPDYLTRVVASWGPDTGLVSSAPVGSRPQGLGGALECAFLNSNQARLQFAADSLGHGFAQGKTLFWNRPMLAAAGGIKALGRHLAEDVTATKIVRAAGKRVSLTPLPFAQPIGQRSLRQVWDRQLRWSRVRRDGFPLLFAGEIMNGAAFSMLMVALAVVVMGLTPAIIPAFAALWYGAEVVLMRRAGWPAGPREIAALPLRDLMLPAIWLATFAQSGIEWRGHAMSVPQPASAPR